MPSRTPRDASGGLTQESTPAVPHRARIADARGAIVDGACRDAARVPAARSRVVPASSRAAAGIVEERGVRIDAQRGARVAAVQPAVRSDHEDRARVRRLDETDRIDRDDRARMRDPARRMTQRPSGADSARPIAASRGRRAAARRHRAPHAAADAAGARERVRATHDAARQRVGRHRRCVRSRSTRQRPQCRSIQRVESGDTGIVEAAAGIVENRGANAGGTCIARGDQPAVRAADDHRIRNASHRAS